MRSSENSLCSVMMMKMMMLFEYYILCLICYVIVTFKGNFPVTYVGVVKSV